MIINNSELKFSNSGTKRSKTDTLALHHTGATALQTVQQIHNYHKNTNGWAGIGYHYYVRKDGSVWYGRPDNLLGAHCPAINSTSVAICFEGNFEIEKMSDNQLKAGKEIIANVMKKYPGINKIVRHSDVASTACPGKNFPFAELKKYNSLTDTTKVAAKNMDNSFKVKILDDELNIRSGAGVSNKITGVIKDHGVYTIVETKGTFGESGSWGRLKSGAGWISLYCEYVKKV